MAGDNDEIFGAPPRKAASSHEIGQSLDDVSVQEIDERITTLQAEITDDGRPFNPLSQAEPEPPKDLASAQIGGLGLKLVRSFAGSIDYQRCDAMNRLTLTFPAE